MRDEIVAEQARLEAIYARLDELKQQQVTRAARLEAAEDRLCFGRAGRNAIGLGETAVTLSTPAGLVPGVTPAPEDNPVKSRLVMAELPADVLRAHQDAIPFPEAVAHARA